MAKLTWSERSAPIEKKVNGPLHLLLMSDFNECATETTGSFVRPLSLTFVQKAFNVVVVVVVVGSGLKSN